MAKKSRRSNDHCFIPVVKQGSIEMPLLAALNKAGLKAYRELADQLRVLQQDLPSNVRGPLSAHHAMKFRRFTETYILVREDGRDLNALEPTLARRLWDASLRIRGDAPVDSQ